MWDYASQNQMGLVPITPPATALYLGSAVHHALASQVNGQDPLEAVKTWCEEESEKLSAAYRSRVGADLSRAERARLAESRDKAIAIVRNYFDYYGWKQPLEDEGLEYVAAEVSWRLKIPGTNDGFLAGTFDGLAVTENSGVWIIEHKTYTQANTLEALATDDQMLHYFWAASQLFQEPVIGVLYDGIAKKLPSVPTRLKSGAMSRARIATNWATYKRALVEADLDLEEYDDVRELLVDRPNPFYKRIRVIFPTSSFACLEQNLAELYRDMSDPNTSKYPNFRWEGCWDCSYSDLCKAQQFDGDFDFVRGTQFRRSEGHRTVLTYGKEAQVVKSVYDLQRSAHDRRIFPDYR